MSGDFDDTIVQIEPDDIRIGVSLQNIRTTWDADSIRTLADSIYEDGLQHPITIMEIEDPDTGDEVIELVSGSRRLRAIQLILSQIDDEWNDGKVPAIEYVGDVDNAKFVNVKENIDRENLNDVDIAAWIATMVEEGWAQKELAEKLGRSAQYVSFRKVFHDKSSDMLKQRLREGKISFTAAYELAKNCEEGDQDKYIKNHEKSFTRAISVQDAQNSNNPNKTVRPSKKQREAILGKAMALADDGSRFAQGVVVSLRWADGLQTLDEIEEELNVASKEVAANQTNQVTARPLSDEDDGEE